MEPNIDRYTKLIFITITGIVAVLLLSILTNAFVALYDLSCVYGMAK